MGNAELKVLYGEDAGRIAYAQADDAGLDLRSSETVELAPGERKLVHTDLKIALPKGTVGMVCPRSGLAAKNGITVVNAPGIVDAGYRGEVGVILLNTDSNKTFSIEKGDRIAQLVVIPFIHCDIQEEDELDETDRGEGGFGHTGTK